jgi:putative DNA primase/helicase
MPYLIITAPQKSGAGSGKGLLIRAFMRIAFGMPVGSISALKDNAELDKKITAVLLSGCPTVCIENFNNKTFDSDLLNAIVTDRPFRLRIFATTSDVEIDMPVFISATGNNLTVAGDLIRRTILCQFDAHMDDPAQRPFQAGFLDTITANRAAILSDLVTIWRWGRQQPDLPHGLPCGSFDQWAQWVRDALIALRCKDVVNRHSDLKQRDPERQIIGDVFDKWWEKHQDNKMLADKIDDEIKKLIDPENEKPSRHKIANFLTGLDGTQQDGFRFVVIRAAKAKNHYQLTHTDKSAQPPAADGKSAPPEGQAEFGLDPPTDSREPGEDDDEPRCAQCNAPADQRGALIEHRDGVLLHRECVRWFEHYHNPSR